MNFIDIHCHPSLKIWLFDKHLYNTRKPQGLNFSDQMFVNLTSMKDGGVNAGVAVHYLPEIELKTEAMQQFLIDIAYLALRTICGRKLEDLLENRATPVKPFEQIIKYIDKFEEDVRKSKARQFKVEVAHSLTEFNSFLAAGNIVFVHSIEGLHCLGTKAITLAQAKAHLDELFNRGVCQITLAHFIENVVVSSQGGIPPLIAKVIQYDMMNTYANGFNEQGDFAKNVVDHILNKGMIIDLVHCTPDAVDMVFEQNGKRTTPRPLVYSHTGVLEVASKPPSSLGPRDRAYLPDEKRILQIKDCGGVLGIIFMDYWLLGKESVKIPALDVVMETIDFIRDVCGGTYDHIAIGSDLDGFTEVPPDLDGAYRMKDLVARMQSHGIGQADIEKICFGNYNRVLQAGWGKV